MSSAPKDGHTVELRIRSVSGEVRTAPARWSEVGTRSRMAILAWRLDDGSMVGSDEAMSWRPL
jgi:hypothetical protein